MHAHMSYFHNMCPPLSVLEGFIIKVEKSMDKLAYYNTKDACTLKQLTSNRVELEHANLKGGKKKAGVGPQDELRATVICSGKTTPTN